jgi:Protein of unknown function (DUF1674)
MPASNGYSRLDVNPTYRTRSRESSVYILRFSGKLSPVTTHPEDQTRIEPLPTPADTQAGAPRVATGREIGGREGPEPTRFGDWELRGRCIDF